MVLSISCTARDPELQPTIRGVLSVYVDMAFTVEDSVKVKTKSQPFMFAALGLLTEDASMGEVMSHGKINRYTHFDLSSPAIEIFSKHTDHSRYYGPDAGLNPPKCTAQVDRGLCYYLHCLRSLENQADLARIVHILSGHIQLEDRQFSAVFDPVINGRNPLSAVQHDNMKEDNLKSVIRHSVSDSITIKAFAREKQEGTHLMAFYEVSIPGEPAFMLNPGKVPAEILKRTGLVGMRTDTLS